MTAATIRDKVAAKVRACASVDHCYGNGSTDTTAPIPGELTEQGVIAQVFRGPTARSRGTGDQEIQRVFNVEFRVPGVDRGSAERWFDQLEDEMVAAFSADVRMGLSAQDSHYLGSDGPVINQDEAGTQWAAWTTRVWVRERISTEMS